MKHLVELAGKKNNIEVLDIGCGPNAVAIAFFANGLYVKLTCMDKRDYPGVFVGDMEKLNLKDKSFDGVQCINALDHTINAEQALKELIRVAKDWVYIDLNLIQKTTSGKGHYWDALEDGTLTNGEKSFDLKEYGFNIKNIKFGGERRYDQIIAVLKK